MEKALNKNLFSQSLRGGLVSFLLSTAFVLLLALIAKLFTLNVDLLPMVNQVLKCVAIAIGIGVTVKDGKVFVKAILAGLIFAIFNLVLCICLGGEFNLGQVLLDLGLVVLISIVVALIKSRKK